MNHNTARRTKLLRSEAKRLQRKRGGNFVAIRDNLLVAGRSVVQDDRPGRLNIGTKSFRYLGV